MTVRQTIWLRLLYLLALAAGGSALIGITGCREKSALPPFVELPWRDFDGQRALGHVEKMVSFGPRPSGSEALAKTQSYIASELKALGLRVEEQTFSSETPRGVIQFKNIIGWLDRGNDVIVLGSHYETKWFADFEFVGANDAGSSSGALLEVARVLAQNAKSLHSTVAFVFFDGEEAFLEYSDTDGFYGSRHLADSWKSSGTMRRVKAMLLMDMVGDRDLSVTVPNDCNTELINLLFQSAESLGTRAQFSLMHGAIQDDHTAFAREGVPSLDIIDFEYGSRPRRNDYWHTPQDTLDKLSPKSLQTVGRVLLKMFPQVDAMPKK